MLNSFSFSGQEPHQILSNNPYVALPLGVSTYPVETPSASIVVTLVFDAKSGHVHHATINSARCRTYGRSEEPGHAARAVVAFLGSRTGPTGLCRVISPWAGAFAFDRTLANMKSWDITPGFLGGRNLKVLFAVQQVADTVSRRLRDADTCVTVSQVTSLAKAILPIAVSDHNEGLARKARADRVSPGQYSGSSTA